jgi:hypothetical protein
MQSNINCSLRTFSIQWNSFTSALCLDLIRVFLDQSDCSCKYRLEPPMCTLPPLSLRQNTCQLGSEGHDESLKSKLCGSFGKRKRRWMNSITSNSHREVIEHLHFLKQTWQFSCDRVRNESLRSNSEQESIVKEFICLTYHIVIMYLWNEM